MTLVQALAAMALAFFERQHRNAVPLETPSEVEARMAVVARAEVRACELEPLPGGYPVDACATMLQNLAQWESALWYPIHAGTVLGPSGERGLIQAHWSVVQIPDPRFTITKAEWQAIGGTSEAETLHAFQMGRRILAWHITRCKVKYKEHGGILGPMILISEYHLPSAGCKTTRSKSALKRAANYERMIAEVRKAMKE